ncbi:restriction endonuclease [Brevundimonas diminuta]|uniref:restriction endonuclease n=1 Tax=Brevundimonas diminuta TaxID=293 RepID=UPI0030FC008D
MPVPDYETLMLPVLRLFGSGAKNVAECLPHIRTQFDITDEEAQELIPSGRLTVLQSRTHWARTYLSKAGLLQSPSRNLHVITDKGRALLHQNPTHIDNALLAQFEGFSDWVERSKSGASSPRPAGQNAPATVDDNQTPDDAMAAAGAILNAALVDDIGDALRNITPQRFERLILDLLIAMGYGGGDIENGRMTKASGDGGIDGIINEDALGLDAVYVQAKRYAPENTVGRPDIQRFIGSLTGESASKGVFVTTSSFSKEAREYIGRIQQRVVLIDGVALAQLMVKHGVGVRERARYVIKDIDRDYFADTEVL